MQEIEPPSTLLLNGAVHAGFGTLETILLLILSVLLLASALISGSEAAFFSLSPTDKEDLKASDSKKADFVIRLLKKPKDLLATILITNNFVNVGIVILSSAFITKVYPASPENVGIHFFVEVVIITLVLLLLGEVIPKIYATKNAFRFSMMMGRILYYLDKIPPVSWIRTGLVKSTSFIQRRAKKGKVDISSDELEQALALTKQDNDEDRDHKILEGIVKFGNTEVRQIMKPRMDVTAIEATTSFDDVMKIILDCGHSRIPVYEETFDKIIGVLFIKDLLPDLGKKESIDWLKLVRKPFFVPEHKKIDDLLKEFQEKKIHIAMVVDEYGGTSGIVTLEDILEEIVGDITDEFDAVEVVYTKIDDNTYLFEGKTALIDFLKVMDVDLDEKDVEFESRTAETLGGFIIEKAGRILENNEFIEVGKLKFIIESSDKKRIKMIKAVKTEIE
jgi:gliding motility-associated protein GldE